DAFATIGMLLMGEANGGLVQRPAGAEPPATPEPVRTGGGDRATEAPLLLQLPPPVPTAREPAGPMPRAAPAGIQGKDFSLSLDEHTNTILAIATPEKHRQIEMLIKELDKRRPQVLVEVTLVSVSAEDSLNLGVELQTQDLGQPWDFELFTLFGLSTINPTTGQRRLIPSVGGTGVLLAPDEVPIIVHALATSGKTRIYSAPRILVDDNATGTIESVAESPYASVNASVSVATTSFAGFAKAGTQLTIEPHIAQGDHLELKYNLTVSSFTGTGTAGVPPPRSADTINSTIRVPDGHTVIVGGLLTETLADSSSHVPYIGEVPILGLLFGTNTQSKSKVRLYAFIKPTILRHDEFEDLKHFSEIDRAAANVPDDYPPDRWQTME
ncbi:MAG: secretin N-terminal domain-containing protein, partial [Planctomycetota bacterium]